MSTAMSTFEPTQVPTYPVIPIELRAVEGESTERVYVNGQQIPVRDGMTPIATALEAAAQEAATQIGDAVRVNAITSDGVVSRLVVQADGTTWDLPERTPRRQKRKILIPAAIAVAAVTATACAGGAVLIARSHHQDTPPATATAPPAELPVVPATGWSSHARWASAPIVGDTEHQTPVVYDGTVVVPTTHGLDAISLATGQITWSSSLPDDLAAGPARTSLANKPALVAQSQTQLLTWPTTGASQPQTIDLPENSQVTFDGASPLVKIDDTHAATISATSTVQQRVVPAGATALAANTDGSVTAANDSGMWWHLSDPDVARDGTQLASPAAKAQPSKVLGYLSHYLVMLWQMPSSHTNSPTYTAAIYDDAHNMQPIGAVQVGTDIPTWTPSPARTWGILGHTVIDLDHRSVHNLGESWTTTTCNNLQCYSSAASDTTASAVDRAGHLSNTNAGGTPPAWVLTNGSAGLVYGEATGAGEDATHIYLTPHQK